MKISELKPGDRVGVWVSGAIEGRTATSGILYLTVVEVHDKDVTLRTEHGHTKTIDQSLIYCKLTEDLQSRSR
jgi:hypothetical protein